MNVRVPTWQARKNLWALQKKHEALAAAHGLTATSVFCSERFVASQLPSVPQLLLPMPPIEMPEYISARIKQCPPSGSRVVPGSTPVVAFGDVRQAKGATLGWNPSKLEFLDGSGRLLEGTERRLETKTSLKARRNSIGSAGDVNMVFEGCNLYFQLRAYRRWFDVPEKVLKHVGASYYDGSACHLDLVQWATDPVWGKLESDERESLLKG